MVSLVSPRARVRVQGRDHFWDLVVGAQGADDGVQHGRHRARGSWSGGGLHFRGKVKDCVQPQPVCISGDVKIKSTCTSIA